MKQILGPMGTALLMMGTLPVMAGGNNECSGAIALSVNTSCTPLNADLAGATESMAAISCGNFTSGSANDLWYSFTATTAVTTVQATGGPGIDPIIEVFSGDCAALVSETCADATLIGGTETASLPTTIGQTYLVRVYYWEYPTAPTDFSFSLCAFEGLTPPVNDACSGVTAQALAAGSSIEFTGDNTGALIAGDYEAGSTLAPYGFASVWHVFTTTECTDVTLSYCGTEPSFDLFWLLLATSCPASDSLIYSNTADTTGCFNNMSMTFEALAAGTYMVPVLSASGSTGAYAITVSAVACPVGIEEVGTTSLRIVPNPNEGAFDLLWDRASTQAVIQLVDAAGRVVHSEAAFLVGGDRHRVNADGRLAPSGYVLRVVTAEGLLRGHVVVR